MIVYPLPPQLLTSPYMDRLYAPMAALGALVRRGRPRLELPRLLLGQGPRVLHLHFFDELTQRRSRAQTWARTLALLALLDGLRARGVRLVWTAHNLQPHETHHPDLAARCYCGVIARCDAVIAHSQGALAALTARYGPLPHGVVIPHGSYIGLYGPMQERAASRAALGLESGGRLTLCLGTLRRYKQIEALIAAFVQLPAAGRGRLLIVGQPKDPAYAAELQGLVAAHPAIELRTGYVPDAELPRYLAAADLVALPYRELLSSGMLLWGLSYGRAVLAPAFGSVLELVADGREGLLYDPAATDGLRAALGRALAHPDLDALGRNGLSVAQGLSWENIAAQTVAVYRG